MSSSTTGIHRRTPPGPAEQPPAPENLGGRAMGVVREEEASCWDQLTDKIGNLYFAYVALHKWYYIDLNLNTINHLTQTCINALQTPNTSHQEALCTWVKRLYRNVYDTHLSPDRGGHPCDVEALSAADDFLNPFLLEEIKKITPYSEEARSLHKNAIEQNRPLSELVLQFKV